jgi:F-type H+-transporting ATPase subunit b
LINFEPITIVVHLALFLFMVYGILNPLLFKPLFKVFDERKARAEGNQDIATEALEKADVIKAEYAQKMENARKEAAAARDEVRKTAEEEEEKIITAAREKAGVMIGKLRENIATEYDEAQKILTAETEAMGKEVASRILGRAV